MNPPPPNHARYQVWVDRGGTFTDCIGRDPETGEVRAVKVPSSDEAPVRGVRKLLSLQDGDAIPPCDVRLGTTLATNALLEARGVPTGVVVTSGLEDALAIGDQRRPALFALDQPTRPFLAKTVRGISARGDHRGRTVAGVDPGEVDAALDALLAAGVESLAVVLLHGHRCPGLEDAVGRRARGRGFRQVVLSHQVAETRGFVARGQTSVVDAYLTPLLSDYLAYLAEALPGSRIQVMQSSGGLTDASRFRGRDAVLSGPAGGVVAARWVADAAGLSRVVGFDMGGTSTDVSRGDRQGVERVHETEVAGVVLRTPMVAVHTVAAGGGSICRFDGLTLSVGPESAGAVPGPLCYGHADAREPTLTDASLWLGRLRDERFPFPLRRAPVEAAFSALAASMSEGGRPWTPDEVAVGCFEIAVDRMAAAVREVTVAKGHDVRADGMVVFGGAGGQFACAVARRLGIRRLVFHPLAGALSALGMGVAPTTWHGDRDPGPGRLLGAPGALGGLDDLYDELARAGRAALAGEGIAGGDVAVTRSLDLRYEGSETALTVALDPAGSTTGPGLDPVALRATFEALHEDRFGYRRADHPIVVGTLRGEATAAGLVAAGDVVRPSAPTGTPRERRDPPPEARVWFPGGHQRCPVRLRERLRPGDDVAGPALVLEDTGTICVDPGFVARLREDGILILDEGDRAAGTVAGERPPEPDPRGGEAPAARAAGDSDHPDPVLLEVFGNRYVSIATQMGHVLQRTAMSPNIRERLDFSCAVFDDEGGLVANAPHIPVHLGAMSESIRAVLDAHPVPEPGDAYLTNDPFGGGSHLPDLTVVSPVFDPWTGALRAFVASRGHHADVGGTTPGSMPPDSQTLDDEGVVFSALRIVRGGRFDRAAVTSRLAGAPHPARRIPENLADLEAQLAANRRGAELLRQLIVDEGAGRVAAYMGHVQAQAAAAVRRVLRRLPPGRHRFEDAMDDGTPVVATVDVRPDALAVDFCGTGPASPGNLNAPRAVTIAAVLYVLRSLVGEPIPLNRGCLDPVTLTIPEGSLLDPPPGAAVAGGNVETSQRIVDVLLGAFGVAAASQGTMNNLTLGDRGFGYYETIGGGAGGTARAAGASGMHTHMTNSRITDPEVLEESVPVRLRRFAYRRGSGGAGQHPGGDGLVRELELLAPLQVTLLSERRRRAPFGLAGGTPGAPGRNLLDGRDLGGRATVAGEPGQVLRVETPGGGGYGPPADPDEEPRGRR